MDIFDKPEYKVFREIRDHARDAVLKTLKDPETARRERIRDMLQTYCSDSKLLTGVN